MSLNRIQRFVNFYFNLNYWFYTLRCWVLKADLKSICREECLSGFVHCFQGFGFLILLNLELTTNWLNICSVLLGMKVLNLHLTDRHCTWILNKFLIVYNIGSFVNFNRVYFVLLLIFCYFIFCTVWLCCYWFSFGLIMLFQGV